MKKPNAEERRSLMAVHLPETLKSKRIQSLVGRFVDDEGELGFAFHSTRYSEKVMGMELEEPGLRNLVSWLAEKKETMMLTGDGTGRTPICSVSGAWTRAARAAPCPTSSPRRSRPT